MEKLSKQQVKTILLNAPKGSDYSIIINGLVSKGYVLEGYNDKPQPQEDGFIKGAVKDVANTLIVKPATRVGQAIGGTISQSIINKMPDTDPNKATYQANLDKQLSQDTEVPIFGKIEAQKGFGEGGGKQITGESLKIGSYLFPYGKVASKVGSAVLGSSTKLTPTAIKTAKTVGNVVSGASGGYMADVGYNLTDENKTLGESFIPGAGTGLGVTIPLLGPTVRALKGKSKTGADVTKRVIQGQTKDIPLAEQAFKNIDLKGVKTRKELSERLASGMENQMNLVDEQLAKDPRALSLDDYSIRVKNKAGQEVKTDVISQSLNHLEEFYKNAGDNLSASNINLIKQKAISEGLTHQEVNNIARMYSEEFGAKAFNKVGDPLTSVNAQMFENTRTGLKQAARGGLGYGEEAQVADRLYSAMSNTKRLIDNGVEKVNALEAKLKERNILQKLSYGAVKVLNAITGGSLKAGVEALGVSNVGNKIDNWVNLENSLAKDLQFIEKANGIKSESALIKFIEDYAKKFKFPGDQAVEDISKRVEQVKNTPNKQGGFVGYSENLANQRMNNTTKNITPKTSNIPKSSPKSTTKSSLKGKGNIKEIATMVDNSDKNNMLAFNEAVFAGKKPTKAIAEKAQLLADEMGLESAVSGNKKLADDFQAILDIERANYKKKMK